MRLAIEAFKKNLTGDEEVFLTMTAPGSFEPYRRNAYYKSHEEFLFALADALAVQHRYWHGSPTVTGIIPRSVVKPSQKI